MRILIAALLLLGFTGSALAKDVFVNGYVRQDGTYVEPHYRTAPDNRWDNNYGSQGNVNPYTGQVGTQTYEQYQLKQLQQQANPYGGNVDSQNANPYGY